MHCWWQNISLGCFGGGRPLDSGLFFELFVDPDLICKQYYMLRFPLVSDLHNNLDNFTSKACRVGATYTCKYAALSDFRYQTVFFCLWAFVCFICLFSSTFSWSNACDDLHHSLPPSPASVSSSSVSSSYYSSSSSYYSFNWSLPKFTITWDSCKRRGWDGIT